MEKVAVPIEVPSAALVSEGVEGDAVVIAPFVCSPHNTAVQVPIAPEGINRHPRSFDWRHHKQLARVLNQESCGACWAVAVAGMISDLCVITPQFKGKENPNFDPLQIISCAKSPTGGPNQGCSGDSPATAFRYIREKGGLITKLKCSFSDISAKRWTYKRGAMVPTMEDLNRTLPSCSACVDQGDRALVTIKSHPVTTPLSVSVEHIKHHVMQGPVVSVMKIYSDFKSESIKGKQGAPLFPKTNGVYVNQGGWDKNHYGQGSKDEEGYHAVVIVGWREKEVPIYTSENGKPVNTTILCWIVRNSWGKNYGTDGGYFYLAATDQRYALNENIGADIGLSSKEGLNKLCGIWAATIHIERYYGESLGSGNGRYPLVVPLLLFGLLVLVIVAFSALFINP